jgi:hypothetical protein
MIPLYSGLNDLGKAHANTPLFILYRPFALLKDFRTDNPGLLEEKLK